MEKFYNPIKLRRNSEEIKKKIMSKEHRKNNSEHDLLKLKYLDEYEIERNTKQYYKSFSVRSRRNTIERKRGSFL